MFITTDVFSVTMIYYYYQTPINTPQNVEYVTHSGLVTESTFCSLLADLSTQMYIFDKYLKAALYLSIIKNGRKVKIANKYWAILISFVISKNYSVTK